MRGQQREDRPCGTYHRLAEPIVPRAAMRADSVESARQPAQPGPLRESTVLKLLGLGLAIGTIVVVEGADRLGFRIPNPPAILMTIVVFSAFTGGMRAGFASAAI